MSFRDRIWMGLRHLRTRSVESALIIIATAIGVALVSGMIGFIRAYDLQTEYLLAHPAYREVLVEVIGAETQLSEPAVPFDPVTTAEINLGVSDLHLAKESVPAIAFGYLADATTLSPGLAGVDVLRGISGGIGGGGAAGGAAGNVARSPVPDGDEHLRGAGSGGGRWGSADAEESGSPPTGSRFDLEQFFQADPDVVTELPLDSFAALRVTADYFRAYGLEAARGTLFDDRDVDDGTPAIVLGSQLARTLFPDSDPVGKRVRLALQTYTVMGVLATSPLHDVDTGTRLDRLAFVPNAAARFSFAGNVVRLQRPTRTLRFAVADSADLEAAVAQLGSHFDGEYGPGSVRVAAPVEALREEREKLGRILSVVLFLAAAALTIASINLFNLMLMRVVKQTKGIGILRALGASRRDIFRGIATESALMSVAGAAAGLGAAPIVSRLLARTLFADPGGAAAVSWPFLAAGALAALAFSLLFSVWPAHQAASVDASLAIRTE